jgi:hypothetical protein
MPVVKFPLLKVRIEADGTVVPHKREGALQPVDDSWWRNVLHDPRARNRVDVTRIGRGSALEFSRLDMQAGDTLRIECACGKSGAFNRTRLIEHLGGDANVDWLARKLIDCGRKNKVGNACRAYCLR